MIFERLTLEGFLSYKEKQTIDFPNVPICLVSGSINSDANLSNGSGKSSLFEAILVSLFGKMGGRGELIDHHINDDMNKMFIETIFLIDSLRYKVSFSRERGASTKHEIFYDKNNKELDSAKWKRTDKKINDILGLSFLTANSTIYLSEREALRFIDGTSTDRKEILRELLNAKVFEAAAESSRKKNNEIEKQIDLNINLIENKKEQIDKEDEYKENLKKLTVSLNSKKSDLKELKNNIQKTNESKKVIELRIEKQKSIEEQIDSEIENGKEQKANLDKKEEKISNLKEENEELEETIQQNTKLQSSSEKQKNEIEKDIKSLQEKLSKEQNLEEKFKEISKKIEKQNSDLTNKEKEITRIQTELKQIISSLEKIKNFRAVCPITEEECPVLDDTYKKKFVEEKNKAAYSLDEKKVNTENEIRKLEDLLLKLSEKQEGYLERIEKRKETTEEISEKKTELSEIDKKSEKYLLENKSNKKQIKLNKESIKELEEECESIKTKIESIRQKIHKLEENTEEGLDEELDKINEKLETLQEDFNSVEIEVKAKEKEVTVQNEKLDQIKNTKKHIQELLKSNENLYKQKKIYLLLSTYFGKEGIQKAIMKQIIPFLERSASDLLKIFNNDSEKIKIKFDLDPKRADGEFKKGGGLDILVIEENKTPKDLRMYSGGERVRLVFSIILALAKLLSKRSGKKHETLIIDEKIAKLDRRGIEQFGEVVDIISSWYKIIFIITHIEALKDMFNDVEILVNKTEEEGSVVTIK